MIDYSIAKKKKDQLIEKKQKEMESLQARTAMQYPLACGGPALDDSVIEDDVI
jgi:hypothetical protein